jgi:hypothetical protein
MIPREAIYVSIWGVVTFVDIREHIVASIVLLMKGTDSKSVKSLDVGIKSTLEVSASDMIHCMQSVKKTIVFYKRN